MLDKKQNIKDSKIGESIFIDFLKKNNIDYIDVTGDNRFMIKDIDFIISGRSYDVKWNYKNDDILIFETYDNIDPKLDKVKSGWLFNSEAKRFAFISKSKSPFYFIDFKNNGEFKQWYQDNSHKYKNILNSEQNYNEQTDKWNQSAYIKIPLCDIPNNLYKKFKI